MAETHPVRAARQAIRAAGRPLTAREALLIAATASAATKPPTPRNADRELIYDVVTELRDACVASVMSDDPRPAVIAIRRMLAEAGIDVGDVSHADYRPAPVHPREAAADPVEYRERTAV